MENKHSMRVSMNEYLIRCIEVVYDWLSVAKQLVLLQTNIVSHWTSLAPAFEMNPTKAVLILLCWYILKGSNNKNKNKYYYYLYYHYYNFFFSKSTWFIYNKLRKLFKGNKRIRLLSLLCFESSILCSPGLNLFDQKYIKK